MNKYESDHLFARLEEMKDLLTKIEENTRPKKRGRPLKSKPEEGVSLVDVPRTAPQGPVLVDINNKTTKDG